MPTHGFCTLKKLVLLASFVLLSISTLLTTHAASPDAPATVEENRSSTVASHAVAMHGNAKYGPDFKQFDYTSHEAQKGGAIQLHSIGTFDSLNPYAPKGNPAGDLDLIYDTLTVSSADEPFTQYGLLAKTIEYPADRSWVIFHLDPEARFHDGVALTAADVEFSFHLLMEKGLPFFSFYYADVINVEVLDRHRVKFNFRPGTSPETLLITGQLPVLPKHFWQDRDFAGSALITPLGSGPYRVARVDPGRSISYERVKDYWGENKPTRKGMYNFDRITIDYYRDDVVALEAFKAGEYDYRYEQTAKLWATGYDSVALRNGRIVKEDIGHHNPSGMQGFVFNLRKPLFQNSSLRQAIGLAFDFEWTNRNLFYGAYKRSSSFFSNSELASSGLPSPAELALLEPFRDQLPVRVFTDAFQVPVSDGDQYNRTNLRAAKKLLDEAGYKVVNNQLMTPDGKQPVTFEILLFNPAFERVANPFAQNLKKLGIHVRISRVDTSQYINRLRSFDFDMVTQVFPQSMSPGNEQRDYWSSQAANTPGSRNLIGITSPAVDALVDHIIQAQTREELVTACHALDRVLLNMHYVVPHWHTSVHRIAYWDKFMHPEVSPEYDPVYSTGLMTWWAKPASTPANNKRR